MRRDRGKDGGLLLRSAGEANTAFQFTAGTRYLVIAYPSSGGGGTLDATHAHYLDVVP